MIVIQRVRVRWSSAGRGAAAATARSGLPDVYPLPSAPDGPPVVHDVLLDEAADYQPSSRVVVGDGRAREVGLWLTTAGDGTVTVDRLPGWAAYPRWWRIRGRLFTLGAGQVGRYRANLRATGCACTPQWYYEQWTIQVANALASTDLFLRARPDRDIDERVHLYGGSRRRSTKAPAG
jgi:hypothetical protein